MISRVSYRRLSKDYWKHHLAELLLIVFYTFLHVMGFVIYLQNNVSGYQDLSPEKRKLLPQLIVSGLRPNIFTITLVGYLGALIGLVAFRYLHSKTKIDFYHSLPLKRIDIYTLILGNVLLMFFVITFLGLLLEALICSAAGFFSMELIRTVGIALVLYVLSFALGFLTEGLAMILTGNMVCGFLGGCVFAYYGPGTLFITINGFASTFFKTYSGDIDNTLFLVLSPMTVAMSMADNDMNYLGLNAFYIGMAIIWIVALLVISARLFIIRPSEKAGSSMAFPAIKPVLRILLVVPMSLLTGWALYQMTLAQNRIWMIVGIVLSAVLYHGLIEALYQMDIRGLWSHKKQMAVTVVLSLLAAGMFFGDVFGYDRYLPENEQLQAILIEDGRMPGGDQANSTMTDNGDLGLTGRDMETAYAFFKDVVKNKDYYPGPEADEDSDYYNLKVTYKLKNGSQKQRSYTIPVDKYSSRMDELYVMEGYKRDNSAVYRLDPKIIKTASVNLNFEAIAGKKIISIGLPYGMESLDLKGEELQEFLEVYKKDFLALSFEEAYNTVPVGCLELSWHETQADENLVPAGGEAHDSSQWGNYYIYPTFEHTLSWLESRGYLINPDLLARTKNTGYELRRLEVSVYTRDENGGEFDRSFTVDDPEVIKEVQLSLIPADLADVVPAREKAGILTDISVDAYYDAKGQDEYTVVMRTDKETWDKLEKAGKENDNN